jgi:hypothetical protein
MALGQPGPQLLLAEQLGRERQREAEREGHDDEDGGVRAQPGSGLLVRSVPPGGPHRVGL